MSEKSIEQSLADINNKVTSIQQLLQGHGAPGNWKTLHLKFAQGYTDTNNILACEYPSPSNCNCFKGLIKF